MLVYSRFYLSAFAVNMLENVAFSKIVFQNLKYVFSESMQWSESRS